MYLKRRTREKDGKTHVHYALCESLRVSSTRVVQRTVLHLGELNTTQLDRWQHTIEVLHEDGQRQQLRLFTDREGQAPPESDVVEVRLSTLRVEQPRRFGDCWVGTQLWEQLGLRAFWQDALRDEPGQVALAQGARTTGGQSAAGSPQRIIRAREMVWPDGHGPVARHRRERGGQGPALPLSGSGAGAQRGFGRALGSQVERPFPCPLRSAAL